MLSQSINSLTPPVGVLGSISKGFEMAARKPWLLSLPLFIDLFLWIGPRIDSQPAIERLDAFMQSMAEESGISGSQALAELQVRYPLVYFLPSLLSGKPAKSLPFAYEPPVLTIQEPAELLWLPLVGTGVGLLIASFFAIVVGREFRADADDLGSQIRHLPSILLQFGALWGLLLLAAGILLMPLFTLFAVAMLINQALAVAMLVIILMAMLFASIFIVFTAHGILLNDQAVLASLWDGLRIMQWNASPTINLCFFIVLIYLVTGWVWQLADYGTWMGPIAMVCYAFVTTGLLASTFVYFKDRHRYWLQLRKILVTEMEHRQKYQNL